MELSDDPEVATNSAETPSSRNEVQPQEVDLRNEQFRLPEQADKPDGSGE